MLRCEPRNVCRIVRRDRTTPVANSGSDDKRINRQLAPSVSFSKKVTCDPRYPSPRRDDLSKSSSEELIDCFVGPSSSIELYQYGGGNTDRSVSGVSASQRSTDKSVLFDVLSGTSESRDRFAVED